MLPGIAQASAVRPVAQPWFRIPFEGSFAVLYGGRVLFVLAAVGSGLVVSVLSYTLQQAMLYSFVLLMPFTLLSGLPPPITNMPPVLQYFTRINPLRYAIDIAQRVYLQGAGPRPLRADLWPLTLIAVVTLSAAHRGRSATDCNDHRDIE
ncbi:MAG: ABC transporter permease [Steroidobacteraceae bacterium]